MKVISSSQSLYSGAPGTRFANAKALALSLAESDSELLEPELFAWIDRSSGMA